MLFKDIASLGIYLMEKRNMNKPLKSTLKWISSLFITRQKKSNYVYLTFDDGPHPINTPKLLTVLDDYKAKATFFMVGIQVEEYPYIAREIANRGHTIGYHSYDHLHAKDLGFRKTFRQLKHAKEIEKKHSVSFNSLYRPPYGELTITTFLAIILSGWKIVLWSKDSKDSFIDWQLSAQEIMSENVASGEIVLLHDDYKNTPSTIGLVLEDYKLNHQYIAAL